MEEKNVRLKFFGIGRMLPFLKKVRRQFCAPIATGIILPSW